MPRNTTFAVLDMTTNKLGAEQPEYMDAIRVLLRGRKGDKQVVAVVDGAVFELDDSVPGTAGQVLGRQLEVAAAPVTTAPKGRHLRLV